MPRPFFILRSGRPRPASRATVFCDGSADGTYRDGVDLELSHWIPNRTPRELRADTSTEICLRFVATGRRDDFDLAINNHTDVDGVLSVLSLVEPELALAHRDVLVGAAEIGDFWAYGDGTALALFAALTGCIGAHEGRDGMDAYEACFDVAQAVLDGARPAVADDTARTLATSVALIDSGRVTRSLVHERFASYVIPRALASDDPAATLRIPEFNEPLSKATLLLPQARNRDDAQRVQLVSVECAGGWLHDLWYPGYVWADTETLWRPPGLAFAASTNAWFHGTPELAAAVESLSARETADGAWTVAERLEPFATIPGRDFPVVVSFLGEDDQPALSSLDPGMVAEALAPAFA